jgi:hypothetical protein
VKQVDVDLLVPDPLAQSHEQREEVLEQPCTPASEQAHQVDGLAGLLRPRDGAGERLDVTQPPARGTPW